VSAGQFQVAAALAGLLATSAKVDMPAIAMPLEFGFRDIGDDVVFKLLGCFKVAAAAVGALLGSNVVFDERGPRGRFGPKDARMFAMFLTPAVVGRTLPWWTAAGSAFAALQKLLYLVLQLRDPPPQFGILGFQFGNSPVPWIIHDRQILPEVAEMGKRKCLTVTIVSRSRGVLGCNCRGATGSSATTCMIVSSGVGP
jgi:hypothetical protein